MFLNRTGVIVFSSLFVVVIAQKDSVDIVLSVVPPNKCRVKDKYGKKITNELQLVEGQELLISFISSVSINQAGCVIDNKRPITNITRQPDQGSAKYIYTKVNASVSQGSWLCTIKILQDVPKQFNMTVPPSNEENSEHVSQCRFNVNVESKTSNQNNWIIIGIVITVIVTLIIIIQTGAIIYFKKKAFRFNRLETLSMRLRNSVGENGEKRYSTKPGLKTSATPRPPAANHQDESPCIYETLNEVRESPPVPPIENIPTLKKKKANADTLTKRKPLPLPIEEPRDGAPIPHKSPVSLKPHTSIRSQRDPTSISGSLIRPKPKTGTLTAAEPILTELDTIFKKRQHGSIPSIKIKGTPTSTLQRKELHQDPVPPNLKMTPQLLASLSNAQGNPSPTHVRKESKPEPILPRPVTGTPAKPAPAVVPKPKPVLPETTPTPPVPSVSKQAKLIRKAPAAPPPVTAKPAAQPPSAKPEAAPLPVIAKPAAQPFSARTEVESVYEQYDNSDEEWTYEALPKYNIYSS